MQGRVLFLCFSFLLGITGRRGVLTTIATPGLADLVVDVLGGGGGLLDLGRLGDDGFPLHCHDGSIEEGKGRRERGGEARRRVGEKKRKEKKEEKGNEDEPFKFY